MTEKQWLASRDVHMMLRLVRGEPPASLLAMLGWRRQPPFRGPPFRASQRQLRLFAVACCRRLEHRLTDECLRRGVEAAEGLADGLGRGEDAEATAAAVNRLYRGMCEPYNPARYQPSVVAVRHLLRWETEHGEYGAFPPETMVVALAAEAVCHGERRYTLARDQEHQEQSRLLRDIVGNPFRRPYVNPAWLAWNGHA
jgi:hypothetical protein